MEGQERCTLSWRSTLAFAALATVLAVFTGCGGGDAQEMADHSAGIELAARLPSDDALNVAVADVVAIRQALGMRPGSIPPTHSGEDDLVFLDEIAPALGVVQSGEFPRPVVDAAMRRARWIAGVAGDKGVTAFAIDGDSAELEPTLLAAGMVDDDGEYVAEDGAFAVALGDGLVVFADDPGDAKPVVEREDGEAPEELIQLDGDGDLITLARFGADCVDAVGTADSPGEPGEIAFFTTATPDTSKITSENPESGSTRITGDSARITIPAAADPQDNPPALQALQSFEVDYDCAA